MMMNGQALAGREATKDHCAFGVITHLHHFHPFQCQDCILTVDQVLEWDKEKKSNSIIEAFGLIGLYTLSKMRRGKNVALRG